MRFRFLIIVSLFSFLLISSCKKVGSEKPTVAVSIPPLETLVKSIAGDDYDVITLIDNNADPESFEPTMSKRLEIDKSTAFFTLGNLFPFEKKLSEGLNPDVNVFDITKGVEFEYGTHGPSAGSNDYPDPHVWTSIKNLKILVSNITDGLISINPEKADLYIQRRDAYLSELDSLDNVFRSRLDKSSNKSFAVWHPSLSYFARDYGLTQIAIGQEHKELSAKTLMELADSARNNNVNVFFHQRDLDSRQARTASDRIGSRFVEIDLVAPDWVSQMNILCDELTRNR